MSDSVVDHNTGDGAFLTILAEPRGLLAKTSHLCRPRTQPILQIAAPAVFRCWDGQARLEKLLDEREIL